MFPSIQKAEYSLFPVLLLIEVSVLKKELSPLQMLIIKKAGESRHV
jgi:hypothetical protein